MAIPFKKGDQVKVITTDLLIRKDAGLAADTVAKAQMDDVFEIVDGPKKEDGFVWYMIKNAKVTGWAASGDANNSWLIKK